MNRKFYWGLGVLIVLLVGVSVVMLTKTPTDTKPEVVAKDVDPSKNAPTPNESGNVLVQHGDHHHEVKISEVENTTSVAPEPKPKSGGLTYPVELLKTDPVKALRREAAARGHWSAKYIPPFPPEDTVAQEIARQRYITGYVEDGHELWDTLPNTHDAWNLDLLSQVEREYGITSARYGDLLRLTWHNMSMRDVGFKHQSILEYYVKDRASDYYFSADGILVPKER